MGPYLIALRGIVVREVLRFLHQRERFFGALVRPLVWLFVFAAGFRAALGVAIIPPYETYIPYEVYIVPGLIGMIQLFNGMQGSLSMVYDREMGSMRVLLTSPLPRGFLLFARLLAGVVVSVVQVYGFMAIVALYGVPLPAWSPVSVLGALGMTLASTIRQLENFAGVMNFVVFPLFFLSSALYPLYRMEEAGELLYWLCRANPFTHGVELVRFALYGQVNGEGLAVVTGALLLFLALAIRGYSPARGMGSKGPQGGG